MSELTFDAEITALRVELARLGEDLRERFASLAGPAGPGQDPGQAVATNHESAERSTRSS